MAFNRLADWRNLRAAWDYCARYGGRAPGPNGLTYSDVTAAECNSLLRCLSTALTTGNYHVGPDRIQLIPKRSGAGTRPLVIQNIEDRVVARATVQIVQPLLEGDFDPNTYACRSESDPCLRALVKARRSVFAENRGWWMAADVRDAFEQVPQRRLLDVVGTRIPNDQVRDLIRTIVTTPRGRGLRQGNPMSPLLLNVYLDHVLDRKWRRQFPETPLLRYVDDVLLLCRTREEAHGAYLGLQRLLIDAAMPLKENPDWSTSQNAQAALVDLSGQESAGCIWLGYDVHRRDGELRIAIAETAWANLEERLLKLHERPDASLNAHQCIREWLAQLGPCYAYEDVDAVLRRVRRTAGLCGFEELPSRRDLRAHWKHGHFRFRRICRGEVRRRCN